MSEKKLVVAVVGATGAVGREMLKTLESRNFPATEVVPFASARSAGTKVPYGDSELVVRELKEDVFEGIDIAIFSAGGSTSEKYAPHAAAAGCIVVDNSSAWRMDERCPLVVPEVNPEALEGHNGIIANPNCSTIQMVVALKPLHDAAGIRRVVVSTYQAVSGSGQKGISELETQVRQMFNLKEPEVNVYPHRIAFNCIPHIDVFLENDYTKEEMKMVHETVKIMRDPNVKVTPASGSLHGSLGSLGDILRQSLTLRGQPEISPVAVGTVPDGQSLGLQNGHHPGDICLVPTAKLGEPGGGEPVRKSGQGDKIGGVGGFQTILPHFFPGNLVPIPGNFCNCQRKTFKTMKHRCRLLTC